MEGHVSWLAEFTIKVGALEAFKELMGEMIAGTIKEPRTFAYEWYISEDGGTVHLFEKYANSEAMISHVNNFMQKWAERFLTFVDVKRFSVYGDPSPAARELLAGFGATYFGPWGGFSRFA